MTELRLAKPSWLRKKLPTGPEFERIRSLLKEGNLHTVCQEARCPNQWECFSCRTATFLIMGPRCTRNCRFCAVDHGPLEAPDPEEPARVAEAALKLGLLHVVVTSVTRDDLPDGGAAFFAQTITRIRERSPQSRVEVLIPDFQGDPEALRKVIDAGPDVLNHNIETVPRLYSSVRPEADYRRSLAVLRLAKECNPAQVTKSGLMLGLGETAEEIRQTLRDLLDAGCSMLTLGQYLQPTPDHLAVERYVPPEEFESWRNEALQSGFARVAGGPFVRSSYHAETLFRTGEIDTGKE
ncbi:MAG: lipoyl synthase [Syntrophobacteraceae bacterium]